MESQRRRSFTPVPRSPLSGSIPVCPDREFSPLMALSPFQTGWVIRVKLSRKFTLRKFKQKNDPTMESSVFSAVFVDDQSTQIEGTFWRDAAEYYHENLEEGKVYYISNFSVRNANKKYTSVDFDYTLHFDTRTTIEEAVNQDTSKMEVKIELTEIENLSKFIDLSTLVHVLAIVTDVAATGRVKRRADASELIRRDVTLIDRSLKHISLTLWGDLAETIGDKLEELARSDPPVVLLKYIRVTSYNGISLASVTRTEVQIDPDIPEAKDLKDWYEFIGKTETPIPLADPLSVSRVNSTFNDRTCLQTIDVETGRDPNKATFSTTECTVVYIPPNQLLTYLANTENNRKVVEQDGKYFCEFNGKTYDTAEAKYLLSLKVADYSKMIWVSLFNEQSEEILGIKAADLDAMRKESPEKFRATLFERQFRPFLMKIKTELRENPKTGEMSLRHSGVTVRPVDAKEEAAKLLDMIQSFSDSKA